MIDFTSAQTAVEAIQTAAECGVNLVVGTTGFSEAQMDEIKIHQRKPSKGSYLSQHGCGGECVL